MSRRRQPGFFDVVVSLPWPVGVLLGIASFAGLRWLAPALAPSLENPLLRSVLGSLAEGAGPIFAWVLLVIFWLAALVSFLNRRQRAALLAAQTDLDAIRALDWRRFELLVGEAFRQQGYRVEESGLGGPDGGVDLILTREGQTTLVQCKHWRKRQIPVNTVREMFGLLQHHRADAVKIVCSGGFSPEARQFAVGKPIDLIDGGRLAVLVKAVQTGDAAVPVTATQAIETRRCGSCGAEMVKRSNRKTGESFLGCSRFPACRGTASLAEN